MDCRCSMRPKITNMSQSYRKSGRVKTVSSKKSWRCATRLARPARAALLACATAALPVHLSVSQASDQPVSPSVAATLQQQRATVEFRVRGTGTSFRGAYDELYSEHNWQHAGAFFVQIPKTVKAQLAARGVTDIARHFYGQQIRATGIVQQLSFGDIERSVLIVKDAADLVRLAESAVTPTSAYLSRNVGGFNVRVHPNVAAQPALLADVTASIDRQIEALAQQIPTSLIEQLQQVTIWVEAGKDRERVAFFHRSTDWLIASAGNSDKAGDIEIVDAARFVADERDGRSSALLHQLAHAYHIRILGADHEGILDAFEQVQLRQMYDQVGHVSGRTGVAHAALDAFEYFAELSEAFLARNDYEPYDRAALKEHDPLGYALVSRLWLSPAN